MTSGATRILVLGASGLIGQALAEALIGDGFDVIAVARRFTPAQAAAFAHMAVACPVVDLAPDDLAGLLATHRPAIVLNCLGVLQDGPRGTTRDVHEAFVERLLGALAMQDRPILLMHVSIPGGEDADGTAFSRTKRAAERRIARGTAPFVILRPGFVIASGAYGGSALIRALAALPLALPPAVATRPFATIAVADIARTVAIVAGRWHAGARDWAVAWDLVADEATTVDRVVATFRLRFGGATPRLTLPPWLLRVGARMGDVAARLGWSPPVRTAALREMLRGVAGDPCPWIAATGVIPTGLDVTLARLPASIQEIWFARLFMLKPLIVAGLALFWVVSGLIAFFPAYAPAKAILTAHGIADRPADAITWISSLADMLVGLAITWRRTCRAGLIGGIGLSLFYMASAALITPDLWSEPLGALVKTGPAIILMAVAIAILEAR